MSERSVIDRGWYYATLADGLCRRSHGAAGRVVLVDRSGQARATQIRAASSVARALEDAGDARPLSVELGAEAGWRGETLQLDGAWIASQADHRPVLAHTAEWIATRPESSPAEPVAMASPGPMRVLFFESLMNTDMPHNDREISGGVLHMISALSGLEVEPVLANVKMGIIGEERALTGLDQIGDALSEGSVQLVCITLLEGYFEGVVALIESLRAVGCRARIAVGGVMPSLVPEHVAAHLPDVQFICRGAGEYFLPELVRIVGHTDIDTPLSEAQLQALSEMRGVIAIDPAGGALVSAGTHEVVTADSLDRIALDLSVLQPRHIEGGIEISTSRGCIHRCTFCTILGRESYQARSVDGIYTMLDTYRQRFEVLYGETIPRNAWRVHISDDDFACDKERARLFFERLLDSPYRLSSVQVSVADLCVRRDGQLLAEPDSELLDAIRPECFADHARSFPESDYVADFRSRSWSSFMQIGVESYCDAELVRLGKGYRRVHVRAIVAELSRRGLHMDGYFILSNSQTTADDLLESIDELCRLKLRFPVHFHLRFPIVPHLVSYFTAATHRRMQRQGTVASMKLRSLAQLPGHPELDYPFVEHDLPSDPWVALAADSPDWLTDESRYLGSFRGLRERWLVHLSMLDDATPMEQRRDAERRIRLLDDRPRRLLFSHLQSARMREKHGPDPAWPGDMGSAAEALGTVTELLGPPEEWLPAFRRYTFQETPRLVVIPTWQCELRCVYCYIPKQDGRTMSIETLERAIELLLTCEEDELILQYFGGEAMMEWDLVQHGIEYASRRASALGKRMSFILSSNGWGLTRERLDWLQRYSVRLELSLDGEKDVQDIYRKARDPAQSSYGQSIAHKAELLEDIEHEVIMVAPPVTAGRLYRNFFHVVDCGYEQVQINVGLGMKWSEGARQTFAAQLMEIGAELRRRWARGERVVLTNLLAQNPMAMRLNGEVTVDWDGTIYGGNAFLHETEHKKRFVTGHLDDLCSFDRYRMDRPDNAFLLEWSYTPDVTENNLLMGRVFGSFLRWMQEQGTPPEGLPLPLSTAP